MKQKYIKTDIGLIRYLTSAIKSDIPTLFVHGFMGTADSWVEIIDSACASALTIDIVGHGKSRFMDVNGEHTIESWSHSLKQLIASQNLEKVNICGYSMGGRLSVAFASQYPSTVNKLILESSSLGIENIDKRKLRYLDDLDKCNQINQDLTKFVDSWESMPIFINQESRNKAGYQEQRKQRLSHAPRELSQALRLFGQGAMKSYQQEFAEFNFPIHLINGSEDTKYLEISDKMRQLNKNVTIHRVHSGHNIHLERPNIFIDILKDTLNSNQ